MHYGNEISSYKLTQKFKSNNQLVVINWKVEHYFELVNK